MTDFPAALAWAEEHDAVLRFNGNRECEGRSIRVTIHGHNDGDRIIAVHQVPNEADLMQAVADAIGQVKAEFENTSSRKTLRLVRDE